MMFYKLGRRKKNQTPNPNPFPVVTGQGSHMGAHIGAPLHWLLRLKKLNVIIVSGILKSS